MGDWTRPRGGDGVPRRLSGRDARPDLFRGRGRRARALVDAEASGRGGTGSPLVVRPSGGPATGGRGERGRPPRPGGVLDPPRAESLPDPRRGAGSAGGRYSRRRVGASAAGPVAPVGVITRFLCFAAGRARKRHVPGQVASRSLRDPREEGSLAAGEGHARQRCSRQGRGLPPGGTRWVPSFSRSRFYSR